MRDRVCRLVGFSERVKKEVGWERLLVSLFLKLERKLWFLLLQFEETKQEKEKRDRER